MRHGKKLNHLGRKAGHRNAMMANMASSLIKHKKITTTVAKAKALRTYVEPLITKSKEKSTHNFRTVFSYLKDKEAVTELFGNVGDKVATRPGGYTRILKVGNRAGDNAEMALIELVDFNEYFTGFGKDKKAASKRTRRGRGKTGAEATPKTGAKAAEVVSPVVEEVEEPTNEVVETPVAEVETAPETTNEANVEPSAEENNTPSAEESEEKKD